MEVNPPLYGSGVLRGSIRGSQVTFDVADITFHGDAAKSGIAGSYIVTRQAGNQLGDFRLARKEGNPQYRCSDGKGVLEQATDNGGWTVVGEEEIPPKRKPVSKVLTGIVSKDYAALNKRCAFLTPFNGLCSLDDTLAYLRTGDQITILSPLTRAEDGADIYRVRTKQGWVGWINSNAITIQEQ